MGIFSSDSKKSTSTTDNRLSDADLTNNTGYMSNGDGAVTYNLTDNGAVNAAIASNTTLSQSALLANVKATESALNSNTLVNAMAFDFGSQALDSNNYTTEKALDTVANFGGSVIDKINTLATTVLVNGEKATRGALELAKDSTESEAASITELMLKAALVLGGIAIIGAVIVGRKK